MSIYNLKEKEQILLLLCMTFEEVLNQDVFPSEADTEFAEYICKSIKALNDKGFINGRVELEYEIEIDMDTFDENSTDAIDFAECVFDNISISLKGKAYQSIDNFREVGAEFIEKSKPIIKCIGEAALQTVVESIVVVGLRAAGIPV